MLFSNERIANLINENFEPAWESVGPVPRISIDFGNGNIVRRTLHGNVATYVCSSDGRVFDILPGAYDANTYFDQLSSILHAFQSLPPDESMRANRAREYHLAKSQELTTKSRSVPQATFSITGVERPARRAVRGQLVGNADPNQARPTEKIGEQPTTAWQRVLATLVEDSSWNESHRRQLIHDYLAAGQSTAITDVYPWLYREVLDTDLADPYLGIGKLLNQNYPFDDDQ